jgi:tripartite-type tricarboxylate transporter receptor subunit TctC
VPSLPNVPTLQEQGLKNFEVNGWHALYAPKGTPKVVLDALHAAMQTALADAAYKNALAKLGASVPASDKTKPEGLQKHLKAEIDRWGPIIKKAGVYAD